MAECAIKPPMTTWTDEINTSLVQASMTLTGSVAKIVL